MSDLIDAANNSTALFLIDSLSRRKTVAPSEIGVCLNCGAAIVGRWCDKYCLEDWDKRESAKANAVTPDVEASA